MQMLPLLLATLLGPALLAQTAEAPKPAAAETAPAAAPEVGLLDAKGVLVPLQEVKMKSSSTMTVPFSGVKTKIKFEKPANLPKVTPGKVLLGKVPADKGGAFHLARLQADGDVLVLKGKFPMKMAIHPPFQPLDESVPSKEPLKEALSPQGVRTVDLPKSLEPGVYVLVRAMASQGFTGMNSEAAGFLFEVPAAQ